MDFFLRIGRFVNFGHGQLTCVIKYILKTKIGVNAVFINKEFCKG